MSSILRKKKPDPISKVTKSDAESPARRDTPLERSRSDLAAVRRQECYSSTTAGLQSPKLQKKAPAWPLPGDAPTKIMGSGAEDGRPFTADAAASAAGAVGSSDVLAWKGENGVTMNGNGIVDRPELGTRRFTATGLREMEGPDPYGAAGRKKKKFGALRRMFRLDD